MPATRTKQFLVGNVGLFRNSVIIPRSSSLRILLSADLAVLKIMNKKKGRTGQTITQYAMGDVVYPVKSLAHIVHHILSCGGTDAALLCSFMAKGVYRSVELSDVVRLVKSTVSALHLEKTGLDPNLVAAHSLRASGAMTLNLHGYIDTTITKMGCWTSLTFLQYIHNQIACLSRDISHKMSMELPFINIVVIEQCQVAEV